MEIKNDLEVVRPLKANKNVKGAEYHMYKNEIQLDSEASPGLPSIPKLGKGGVLNVVNNRIF